MRTQFRSVLLGKSFQAAAKHSLRALPAAGGRYPIQEEQIFEFRQAKRAGPVATRKIQKQRKSSSKIVAINNNNNNNNDNKKNIK